MGILMKSVLFLLRRGPEIYQTGMMLRQSIGGRAALPPGEGDYDAPGGGRIGAIERELDLLREDDRHLSGEVERLSKEVESLRAEVERVRSRSALLLALLAVAILAGLAVASLLLARFP